MKKLSFVLKNLKSLDLAKGYNCYKSAKQQGITSYIDYIPPRFSLTITSRCNLRCPTCQYMLKDPELFENSGFMKFADYRHILDQYQKYITNLTLTGGEVTLHPEFEKFIDFSKTLDLKVGAISNGILVGKKVAAFQKLDDVNITLDAFDYPSFAKNRGGTQKQWDRIMAGLQALRENHIRFSLSFLATSENIEELFQLIELADRYQPYNIRINSFNPHQDTKELVLLKSDQRVMRVISDIIKRNDYAYNIKMPFVFDEQHPYFNDKICDYPWHGVYINDKCDISYCCQLPHDSDIGNMRNGYLFNSKKMRTWRKMLMDHKLPVDCRFCHRRFKGNYTKFIAAKKAWKILDPFK